MPWEEREGVPTMKARDVQHLMDSPWMASPKLWHDSYREQDLDVHIWVHDTLPEDTARFVADHVAFTAPNSATLGAFPCRNTISCTSFPTATCVTASSTKTAR